MISSQQLLIDVYCLACKIKVSQCQTAKFAHSHSSIQQYNKRIVMVRIYIICSDKV